MKCFNCKAETELRFRRRPICASAECNLVAREAAIFESLRVPLDRLAKVEPPSVTAALAEREHMTRVLYGKLMGAS